MYSDQHSPEHERPVTLSTEEKRIMVDYRMKAATIEVVTIDARTPLRTVLAKLAGMYWRKLWTWIKWRVAVTLRLRSR